jgi:hypothetical protein
MSVTVLVEVDDLAALADLICDRDHRDKPPTLENIGACHALIQKMMGPHVSKHYAEDESYQLGDIGMVLQ